MEIFLGVDGWGRGTLTTQRYREGAHGCLSIISLCL
jgi:hypothetical protein